MNMEPDPNTSNAESFVPDMGQPVDVGVVHSHPVDPTDPAPRKIELPKNWYPERIDLGNDATTNLQVQPQSTVVRDRSHDEQFVDPRPVRPSGPSRTTSEYVFDQGAALNPSASVPPPVPGSHSGTVRTPDRPIQHPVLTELLRDFGIQNARTRDVNMRSPRGNKYVFKIRQINAEILGYAVTVAAKLAQSNEEYGVRLRMISAALAIVRVNDVPVHELFNVDISGIRETIDPDFPPFPLVVKTGVPVLKYLLELFGIGPIQLIADKYDEYYGENTEDEAVTELPVNVPVADKRVRFKCNIAGCGHIEDVVPEDAGNGQIVARYCPKHGVAMTPIGYVRDLVNTPLE